MNNFHNSEASASFFYALFTSFHPCPAKTPPVCDFRPAGLPHSCRGVRISLRTNTIRSPKPSPTGKVARASPASARRMRALPLPYGRGARRSAKAPLADQGELSRASPASTRLRGSELPSFCVLSLTRFDNPSVKNQRFLPAPFTQGSLGCSRTSASFEDSRRGRCPHRPVATVNSRIASR